MTTARTAERRLLLLTCTRWLPTGLVFGLTVLLPLQRGLSLADVGAMVATQGFVVLALELPSGGLADAVGRRPVLLLAGVLGVASTLVFVLAQQAWVFVVALALQGVYRALDSGPLEAWFVDTALADDPTTPVERALSRAGTVLGAAIAVGALVSAGLVAWHPVAGSSALLLPFGAALAGMLVHLVLTAVLVTEAPHRERGRGAALLASTRQAPRLVVDGVRLLRADRVLRCVVLVEVFWGVGMIGFETLMPARLAEQLGGVERAAVVLGPAAAGAWGLYAVGAGAAGLVGRRVGVAWTAVGARLACGLLVVVMGLATGPVGLVVAYLAAYTLHGANNPVHATLLHRRASAGNRATVLSINSMVSGGCYSLGVLVLGPLAAATSTGVATVVAGAFSALGAALYLPAVRTEQR